MKSYVVIWNQGARNLIGVVEGVTARTSQLVRLDEERQIATTRSGTLYQLQSASDEAPAIAFAGILEIPLAGYGFAAVRGVVQLFGRSPTGRLYYGYPEALDAPSALCRATDGRLFRLCGRYSAADALDALGRLAPSTLVKDVVLFEDPPETIPHDVLWLGGPDQAAGLTVQLPA
jgi:hypothetical protein